MQPRIVRLASENRAKLNATVRAVFEIFGNVKVESLDEKPIIKAIPVNLQARADLPVRAQPEGEEETKTYALMRLEAMRTIDGSTGRSMIDISIESGLIGGKDVAIIVIATATKKVIVKSKGYAFPKGTVEEARRRKGGFTTWTPGMIAQEWYGWPNGDWHGCTFWGRLFRRSREKQIYQALVKGLKKLQALS